jgi:DUF1680 family protein
MRVTPLSHHRPVPRIRLRCSPRRFLRIPALLCIVLAVAPKVNSADPSRLQAFGYRDVRLDLGPLQQYFEQTAAFYLRIPNDALLKGFRERAGQRAPGKSLGGWYAADTSHIFGQIVSSLARIYATTGEEVYRTKAVALIEEWAKCLALIEEWAKCLERDGYFYYSRTPNAPLYTYDKMVGALVDLHLYCDNQKALDYLGIITAWAQKNLSRENIFAFSGTRGATEWYTLSENLYRAYAVTGDRKYADFAAVWEYSDFWSLFAEGRDIFSAQARPRPGSGYHAYSHVNSLNGAAAAYLHDQRPDRLLTIRKAYDYLAGHQLFATGGFGPREGIIPPEQLPSMLGRSHNHFETQCGTWAALKLSKHLLTLTGDAKYGDWVERLMFNATLASPPPAKSGQVFYYSDYNVKGAEKKLYRSGWSCCAGTLPLVAAEYYDLIYFKAPDGLNVNLYTPSTVEWLGPDRLPIRVQQITQFPAQPYSEFVFSMNEPAEFTLSLRVPAWLSAPMSARINGEDVPLAEDTSHWARIKRIWRDGDRLQVHLPIQFWTSALPAGSASPLAVLYGPVVMAFRSREGNPYSKLDFTRLQNEFVARKNDPLVYRLASDKNVESKPFYAIQSKERYYVYLEPDAERWVTALELKFKPRWFSFAEATFTNINGASAKYKFRGTGVRVLGHLSNARAAAEVRIDGRLLDTIRGAEGGLILDRTFDGLEHGKHTFEIRFKSLGNRGENSGVLNLDALELIGQ